MSSSRRRTAAEKGNGLQPGSGTKTMVAASTNEMQAKGAEQPGDSKAQHHLTANDRDAIILLVILYFLQGIPVGLAFGTMPFLLKAKLSYSDIGIFGLCTYPYSLKLLWSPFVDSVYLRSLRIPAIGTLHLGRRKTWIVPMQAIVGLMLWSLSNRVDSLLLPDTPNVWFITWLFFLLVLFAATQDIAVDGWALTLLSEENLSYASTAQTVGLNSGYFMSFTVFLAFNSVEFSNKWFRAEPLEYPVLSLSLYLKASALLFLTVTTWLLLFMKEEPESEDHEEMSITTVYKTMLRIVQLRHVQSFIVIHLVAKIGFQANEAVTGLKLVEKGFGKEDLALAVLIDFPFQLVLGYLAAKWSKGDNALRPWIWGFVARLAFAVINMGIVKALPNPVTTSYFMLILGTTVAGSFASTVQFVGISAFHTQIADPVIGGTYMTLLNTVSNLGGTWPRYFVMKAVDRFTVSSCETYKLLGQSQTGECTSEAGIAACAAVKGTCKILKDGYYFTSTICVAVGTLIFLVYILPACFRLQKLPAAAWRVKHGTEISAK